MKSEEKLNHLFETLRTEKTSTSVSDVTKWLQAGKPAIKAKTANKLTFKKLIIMSSIVSLSLTGIIVFFYAINADQRNKQQLVKNDHVYTVDTFNKQKNETTKSIEPIIEGEKLNGIEKFIISEKNLDFNNKHEMSDEINLVRNKVQNQNETILENKFYHVTNLASNTDKKRGTWRSENDYLKVDTLFSNVKVLVFTGDFNDNISIKGSKRSDLSLVYTYERKTKGLFISGKKQPIELKYEINDTILTIQLDRKSKTSVSVFSVTNENNKLEFNVPENLDVQLRTEYGDIEASGLKNKTKLHTSYGDFVAQDLSGEFKLDTDYGDISLKNSSGSLQVSSNYGDINSQEISGDIDLKTIYGDITTVNLKGLLNIYTEHGDVSGRSMLIEELASIKSGYGEIDLQIVNPITDFTMDLNTEFGDIKLDRADTELKSQNRLKTGNGKLKLNVRTEFGDIKIR